MSPDNPRSLEEQVGELRLRVAVLEQALREYGIVVARAAAVPAQPAVEAPSSLPAAPASIPYTPAASFPTAPIPPHPTAIPLSQFPFSKPISQEDQRSLENRIGSQWFNRIGILAVLIGMAWFLKFAIDNHWIGPLGRVLIGLVAGAAITAWSERFRAKGYAAFAYSLKAIGSGTLYLSLWAAFSLYQLIPASAAFLAMIAVTAFNGFMAWVQDAELLALYAIVGALSTPILVSTGENHEVTLFSYLLLLDVAVLILVILKPWSRLLVGAFIGTVTLFIGWASTFYAEEQMGRTSLFLALFFLIFALAPRLIRLRTGGEVAGWDLLAGAVLPIVNSIFGFVGFYLMLDSTSMAWAEPWTAVAFAAFYLLLLRLPESGRLHASPAVLSSLHLAAAVVFLTIAIPLKTHGRWLTIGWLVEGAALLWVASRTRAELLRALALICLVLGLGALLVVNPTASTALFFNQRFATYCVAIAVFAFVAWLSHQSMVGEGGLEVAQWPGIAGGSVLVINCLILLAVGIEIHQYWWYVRWSGPERVIQGVQSFWLYGPEFERLKMYAQFTYSAWFMVFGAVLLAIGFARRSAFLRWQALVLIAVTIAKVFLLDMSQLSQGFRIVSFLGLGALLLGVSFVYQRDWLNLRGQQDHKA
jgi:uncharacterized membrane protein